MRFSQKVQVMDNSVTHETVFLKIIHILQSELLTKLSEP